jgi:glycosyltransferase involved in cell wall biosynthesis
MKIAVIPATYNRPDALAALLEGYLAQDGGNFEIIVADDGSGEATLDVITNYQRKAPFRIDHVWQENKGYRAATIRNKALAKTTADYVIYTDGDCIPMTWFISAHRKLAERGRFVAGNRVLLSENFTNHILSAAIPVHQWKMRQWLGARQRGDINRIQPLVRLSDNPLRKLMPERWKGCKTCNLGVWRDDLLRVNGMDESYAGWGLEDSDLVIRLLRAGVRHKSGRFSCPVLHLWHREQDKSKYPENQKRLEAMLHAQHISAAQGLSQHL